MSDPSLFRTWLKRQRAIRGLTQEALAELVGYAAQTIRKIEGGYRAPAYTLPAYLSPFVGREQKRAELAELLVRPGCRLVSTGISRRAADQIDYTLSHTSSELSAIHFQISGHHTPFRCRQHASLHWRVRTLEIAALYTACKLLPQLLASHPSEKLLMSSSPKRSGSPYEPAPPASSAAALEVELAALRQELSEVRVLNRIVVAVSTARETATAFERACEELARAFAVPQVALAALDTSTSALHIVAEYCAPGRPSGMGERIPVADNPILAYITAHHAPLAISDVRTDPRVSAVRDLFARRGTQAILIAPVFAKDVLIGTVGIDAIEPRSFTEREIALAQAISDAISQGLYNVQLYEAVQHELATRLRAEQVIREQATMLAQLSTPLIPISERVLILPLIGELDAARAEHVLRTLLEGIERQRAEVLIIDITGMPIVDTHVAGTLLQAARAAQLLGTETMITGIRPEVAQTLVGLGADLRGVRTFGTLQSAVSHAFRRS